MFQGNHILIPSLDVISLLKYFSELCLPFSLPSFLSISKMPDCLFLKALITLCVSLCISVFYLCGGVYHRTPVVPFRMHQLSKEQWFCTCPRCCYVYYKNNTFSSTFIATLSNACSGGPKEYNYLIQKYLVNLSYLCYYPC